MNRERAGDRALNGVERALVDLLRDRSPRMLDDMVEMLPKDCYAQIFLTIDRWSREGVVRLLPGPAGYRVEFTN